MIGNNKTGNAYGSLFGIDFNIQCQNTHFSGWITLVTLCMAPLMAHLLAGVPGSVYLHNSRPRWYDRICHYNPTAIIWRYFAIIDRRIRAREWDSTDIAASNTLFWTDHGWDGSVEIMFRCRDLCLQPSKSTVDRIFSSDTLKTVIVALQGAQALYLLINSMLADSLDDLMFSMDTIFIPIATIGLLRMFAALWLTDKIAFVDNEDYRNSIIANDAMREPYTDKEKPISIAIEQRPRFGDTTTHFRPAASIRGVVIRMTFLLYYLLLLTVCMIMMFLQIPWWYTATTFLVGCFYTILLVVCIFVFVYYFITCSSPPTVLPCVGSMWFRLYTYFLFLLIAALVVVAALETRKTPCGIYTTLTKINDPYICSEVRGNATLSSWSRTHFVPITNSTK